MEETFALTTIAGEEQSGPHGPITGHEERELRRVFDMLCDFSEKKAMRIEVIELQSWLTSSKSRQQATRASGITTNSEKIESTNTATQQRIDELNQEVARLEGKVDKKITAQNVADALKWLNHKANKKDIEEMIWEIDEDLDGCLNWSEFRLMFKRNIVDKSGLEPSRMYNLAQFLIYDHNENASVSVDETMNMLYARYGRSKMELKLKELFGEDMHETGRQGGEITFAKYLTAVESVQLQTFWGTTKGRITAMKSTSGAMKKSSSAH